MTEAPEAIRLGDLGLAPVNRPRLARYLELPSVRQIDPVTEAEIRKLDAHRSELLSLWHSEVAVPIDSIDGPLIRPGSGLPPIEATASFGCRLRESRADALIIAAFTVGKPVDQLVAHHLERQELFEAFVLKQWAATMAEQARIALTRGLRAWAEARGRALLPYDGPGYNGWPLEGLSPLLELLYGVSQPAAGQPIRATALGVLLPVNSMLIVHGMTSRLTAVERYDEALAQCHRCAMRNCRYRTAAMADVAC